MFKSLFDFLFVVSYNFKLLTKNYDSVFNGFVSKIFFVFLIFICSMNGLEMVLGNERKTLVLMCQGVSVTHLSAMFVHSWVWIDVVRAKYLL